MLVPGRRTVATTKSPGRRNDTLGPTTSTCPKPSWPITRKSYPSGAAPYSAALISLSVPSTPTRSTLTRTPRPFGISDSDGLASSARCTLLGRPGTTAIAFMGLSALLKKFCDEGRPAGLVAGADGRSRVAVEILVEGNQIVPVRIGLKQLVSTEDRAPTVRVVEQDSRQPLGNLRGNLRQRHHLAGSARTFDSVRLAEIV